MSTAVLKEQCVPGMADINIYMRLLVKFNKDKGEVYVGHLMASNWRCGSTTDAWWVTQLVVHSDHRRHGYATALLRKFNQWVGSESPHSVGVLSSHPATIRAFVNVFGEVENVVPSTFHDLDDSSPVQYVRNARLCDEESESEEQKRSSYADTGFYIDHAELDEVISSMAAEKKAWTRGPLPEGCEYLVTANTR